MKIFWTDEALEDLRSIHEYISRDSEFYASRQIEKFLGHEKQIMEYPKAGRLVPEYHDENIREIIEGNYRIIYKIVSDEKIDILTVVHGAREL